MDASLPRRDRATAQGVSERPQPSQRSRSASPEPDDASVSLPAHPQPPVRKRVDSPLREVYRDALVAVALWLVLLGHALFALSATAARPRPTAAPPAQLSEVATPGVSGL